MLGITSKGLQSCPKDELLLERYIRPEGLLNSFLRLLRDNGPKDKKEVELYFNFEYRPTEIARMIEYATIKGYVKILPKKQYFL